jgi:hypothetical protein
MVFEHRRILSPVRLPVPSLSHMKYWSLRHKALADPAGNATWTDPPRCLAENSHGIATAGF